MLILSSDQRLLLTVVVEESERLGMPVYLVGGVVRDLLLGFTAQDKDFDFIVVGDAETLSKACAGRLGGQVRSFKSFLTSKIVGPHQIRSLAEVDFATARTEHYVTSGALPRVERARSIQEDVARRDFSVNAIALPLGPVLALGLMGALEREKLIPLAIDQFGGIPDLAAKSIRILHAKSFQDDPTRMYRAARYVSRLNGALASETAQALHEAIGSGVLAAVSWARTANELRKIAQELRWGSALQSVSSWGILQGLGLALPEETLERWLALSEVLEKRAFVLPSDEVFFAVLAALLSGELPAGTTSKGDNILVGMNLSKAVKSRIHTLMEGGGSSRAGVLNKGVLSEGEAALAIAERLIAVAQGRMTIDLFVSSICNVKS
jgi:tRNA nucleotidyltransferase (CCA-adding enzyme)